MSEDLLRTIEPQDYRLVLTQLGQLASPLHAAIFAFHLQAHLQQTSPPIDLRRRVHEPVLRCWRNACVHQDAMFPTGTSVSQVSWLEVWTDPNKETLLPTPVVSQPTQPATQAEAEHTGAIRLDPSPTDSDPIESCTQPYDKTGIYLTRLFHDMPPQTTWLWTDTNTTVGDLLLAEQALLGDTHQVLVLQDHLGSTLEPRHPLEPNQSSLLRHRRSPKPTRGSRSRPYAPINPSTLACHTEQGSSISPTR